MRVIFIGFKGIICIWAFFKHIPSLPPEILQLCFFITFGVPIFLSSFFPLPSLNGCCHSYRGLCPNFLLSGYYSKYPTSLKHPSLVCLNPPPPSDGYFHHLAEMRVYLIRSLTPNHCTFLRAQILMTVPFFQDPSLCYFHPYSCMCIVYIGKKGLIENN